MPSITKPVAIHPSFKRNDLNLTIRDYEGAMSTLCAGCGHDSVTAALVRTFWELSTPPHMIAKLSGIGCSSKTPTYFCKRRSRFQLRARPDAFYRHGGQRSQPRPYLYRHLRRWRLSLHRPGPVVSCHPPQSASCLRYRKQRRLRTDQGTVFRLLRRWVKEQERRGQPHVADRPSEACPYSRRDVRSSAAFPVTRNSLFFPS